ncbi:MAG: bifunctional 4-hydroxy-2-oxoglutarate aldolase/2-dehydro-3-deoxy-phosphogluconate aldolase [Candidatus Eisenbacteria bacterium]|uniref:Bifunctional 4-hydroxy-2-oxoglutarate aldolase/2-dehydro-3-deoxy-phosphogluconate aldolase n=1 Tax=Eiseniibacteriota bacterium TaxID=2212470 RepID=A0A9D6QI20_UNCEI|nr:bifunctional 4-hydroxy-2-oxoglutarate aldolase/2-dehydro-3-deoxy-phosphogluconate aldolase [Candidatus Eisenbacteria bacterium]MBI3538792.1 bifunctional 4-hydroxy-2-oxoglutarate aldolase/2-dehydro-3-deoxy-phosphogluconate aldolase [Candidatus Eisenbacteria bacterium]
MEPSALTALRERPFVAAIRAATPDDALEAARAVAKGGILHLEITFTVPEAPRVMRALADLPGAVVGCGTALTADQARAALDAGAQFVIAPNTSAAVAKVALDAGVMYCPGAYTTTEIVAARDLGAHLIKVYPVGVAGGPAYIRVIRDPLPDIPLMASGGTTLDNAIPFLAAGAVAIGLGAALADPRLAAAGQFDEITRRARAFVDRYTEWKTTGVAARAHA